ncbi:MAG: transglutaminaseTgpA domain-containing protein [Gaiellaceae bacterium]
MARSLALYVLPAVLVATAWARLEEGTTDSAAVAMLFLAAAPVVVRPWWGRLVAAAVASMAAVHVAFDVSLLFRGLGSQFKDGFLAFYDVPQPFLVPEHPLMHAVVLVAIFGFGLALALAIAARRPVVASVVLLVGSVWPATLVSGSDLARGALTLAAVLGLLAFGGPRPTRSLRSAAVVGALLVAAAVGASTSQAVAKPEIFRWQDWDLYDKPAERRGVGFVWNATYRPLEWPKEETTMLTVSGPRRNLYWRATTLDTFRGDRWVEELPVTGFFEGQVDVFELADGLLPDRAYDSRRWIRADVKVEALRDKHLIGASMPVAYDAPGIGAFRLRPGGIATFATDLPRGAEYTVWSYAPSPKPDQLARPQPDVALPQQYLEIAGGRPVPPFRRPNRHSAVLERLGVGALAPYRALYEQAREVVGNPGNQYAAAVALEAWFRSEGGFTYDEAPPQAVDGPPLVAFLQHKRGYCQYYAGAMALMLRYLGIPARVAVGFTSGTLNKDRTKWTVTDHDAHAWVEVWFPRWGWIPFDPTPGRGQLSGPYSYAGANFDAAGAARALGGEAARGQFTRGLIDLLTERRAGEEFQPVGGGGGSVAIVRERGASLLKLLLIVAGIAGAGIVLVKRGLLWGRSLSRDPRRVAAASRREIVDFLVDQGIEIPRSATPRELAVELRRMLGVEAGAFADALAAARFAPPRESRAAARRVRHELRAVRRGLRGAVGVPRRLRGAVSLRSLAA